MSAVTEPLPIPSLPPSTVDSEHVPNHADGHRDGNNDNGALSSAPDSPAIPSPPTNVASPPVKIDLGYSARESDVRHEHESITSEKNNDDVSIKPQISTPVDPGMWLLHLSSF